ncbi:MAG: hypothetical protein CVV56_08005 [Tenericutes bacterium HGW-Tenericutes-1]|jgi:hypothetical protein|nr:MAG: hypothetical protein CVV56_08005 [Tenericutes bacterium HGW-Tenericutes-1]PKM95789.1 MAG: hypothetical protein CVU84_03035 [Firmicutes bacterium HGW-Firmicutes-1]
MEEWVGAHEWVENHTMLTDKDLMNPDKSEIEKITKEIEQELNASNMKQRELDNILIHSKDKLISFCIENLNKSFQMFEVTRDFPVVKSYHYK